MTIKKNKPVMRMRFESFAPNFICQISFLKMFCIQLSCRLKKYMREICQNVQKVDYQRSERKSFFQISK